MEHRGKLVYVHAFLNGGSFMRHLVLGLVLLLSGKAFAYLPGIEVCKDIYGSSVAYYPNYNLGMAGQAVMDGSNPVILVNPNMMGQYSISVQQFIYAHECAHHGLGHITYLNSMNSYSPYFEMEADCRAVQVMKKNGVLNQQALNDVLNFVVQLQADSSHPGGYERITHIQQNCLN
jgi:hypothetical protein